MTYGSFVLVWPEGVQTDDDMRRMKSDFAKGCREFSIQAKYYFSIRFPFRCLRHTDLFRLTFVIHKQG